MMDLFRLALILSIFASTLSISIMKHRRFALGSELEDYTSPMIISSSYTRCDAVYAIPSSISSMTSATNIVVAIRLGPDTGNNSFSKLQIIVNAESSDEVYGGGIKDLDLMNVLNGLMLTRTSKFHL